MISRRWEIKNNFLKCFSSLADVLISSVPQLFFRDFLAPPLHGSKTDLCLGLNIEKAFKRVKVSSSERKLEVKTEGKRELMKTFCHSHSVRWGIDVGGSRLSGVAVVDGCFIELHLWGIQERHLRTKANLSIVSTSLLNHFTLRQRQQLINQHEAD